MRALEIMGKGLDLTCQTHLDFSRSALVVFSYFAVQTPGSCTRASS